MAPSPTLEKFVDQLPVPESISLSAATLTIGAYKISQKLHRDLPSTPLYAYGTSQSKATYPGPTLVARRGVPARVKWENHIPDKEHMFTVDKTLDPPNPSRGGVPIVTHLHGAEDPSTSDGHPQAWFTAFGERGPASTDPVYYYPNEQYPTMLWYHDHTLRITRLNVYAGLAGAYILTWPQAENQFSLPSGQFEIPLIIQDRQFYSNGSLNFPNVGIVPSVHPNWCPEFLGDTIVVNGKVWPYLNVQARKYRFRFLNGANARFFTLSFSSSNLSFLRIGTDGGYLVYPRRSSNITLAPAYRVDTVVDFSVVAPGSDVLLLNSAPAPFPEGSAPSGGTEMVMKFHVIPADGDIQLTFPPLFRPPSGRPMRWRSFTLVETTNEQDLPIAVLIDGKKFEDSVTEFPVQNSTEVWELINLTPDAHPIHIHLLQLSMLNRQQFNQARFESNECSMKVPYPYSSSCFTGRAMAPGEDEIGWKDTFIALPGYVTRLLLKFTSQDGSLFRFDATVGPGYAWHCHILDHEDNDMMRPFIVTK